MTPTRGSEEGLGARDEVSHHFGTEGVQADRPGEGGAYVQDAVRRSCSPAALTVGSVAELSQEDGRDGSHARNVEHDVEPTPSPSQEVMCVIHGKFRICRDLARIPGTNDWACNDRDPCGLLSRSPSPVAADRRHSLDNVTWSPRGEGRGSSSSDGDRRDDGTDGSDAGDPASASAGDAHRDARKRHKLRELRSLCPQRSSRSRRAKATGSKRAPGPTRPKGSSLAPSVPGQDVDDEDDDPLGLMGAQKELVRCTLHGKWRHPDRMARKRNGDWVCTGDDRCKGAIAADASSRVVGRTIGLKRTVSLRKAAEAKMLRARAPPLQPPRVAASSSQPVLKKRVALTPPPLPPPPMPLTEPEAAGGEGRGAGRSDDVARDFLATCAVHGRQRHVDRLQKRRGQWVCKPEDRCRNADEVRCVTHGRWRSRQNMTENKEDGTFTCKPGCECH